MKVTVTRSESTELYVEVPDDFEQGELLRNKYQSEMGRIAMETTDSSDWDKYRWSETVEVQAVVDVDAWIADQFMIGTLRIKVDSPPVIP